MTSTNSNKEVEESPNQYVKEQDRGIIEAFSKGNHQVLTSSEVAEEVSLSKRQVRRRLNSLADQEIIGQRVVSGVKLVWLRKNVKEPITVQYPLLRYVRDRVSVQLFIIGMVAGIISVLLLLTAAISIGYEIPIGIVAQSDVFEYGVLAAVTSALFIIVSVVSALIGRLIRQLGLDVESRVDELMER